MEYKLSDLAILKMEKVLNQQIEMKYQFWFKWNYWLYSKALFNSKMIIIGRVGANCGSVHYHEGKVWLSDNTIGVEAKKMLILIICIIY